MDMNQDLLQALQGIQQELHTLNKTLSGMAAQQGRPAARAAAPESSAPSFGRGRPPMGAGRTGGYKRKSDDGESFSKGRPSAGGARTGGYKRKSEDGELAGYGAEMSARFPQKRKSPAAGKGKPPAKKGGGYPKKPR
jgi:hypothetical protein